MKQSALAILIATCTGLWPLSNAVAAQEWDACAMLSKADVDAAFAPRVFEPGARGNEGAKSSPRAADLSSCTYSSPGASVKDRISVTLLARRSPDDASSVTPQTAKEGAVKLNGVPADVSGLGEGAYWVNLGSSTFPVIQLNVFRGKREWYVVSAATKAIDTNAALAGLTKAAKSVASRK
ncbi:MAG: hypothetical protein ACOYNZ_02900 [Rhodoferax sp.]